MDFCVVVGAADTRKTSTIRSLTGVGKRTRVWDLEVFGQGISAFVETSAPQEQHPRKSPADVEVEVASAPVTHAIIALHHVGARGQGRDADDYISHFLRRGWKCLGILITSPEPASAPLATKYANLVDYAPSLRPQYAPANAIADVVRQKWGL